MDATVATLGRSRDTDGATVFVRHAFAPNSLGYCGPPHSDSLFEYAVTGRNDHEVARLATEFSGAWPYLRLIAEAAGINDPLDRRVVEAYWIGSPLLQRIGPISMVYDEPRRGMRHVKLHCLAHRQLLHHCARAARTVP